MSYIFSNIKIRHPLATRHRLEKFDTFAQLACCPEVRFIKSVGADRHKQLSNSDSVPQQRDKKDRFCVCRAACVIQKYILQIRLHHEDIRFVGRCVFAIKLNYIYLMTSHFFCSPPGGGGPVQPRSQLGRRINPK